LFELRECRPVHVVAQRLELSGFGPLDARDSRLAE
jgi:hypothetical protein